MQFISGMDNLCLPENRKFSCFTNRKVFTPGFPEHKKPYKYFEPQ